MTKLTLQEQVLEISLVSSKRTAKIQRTIKKSRIQARETQEAVEENKKAQLKHDKRLSEQQKQAVLVKEYRAQMKQLIEMNHTTVTRGDIGFNFTDNNLIEKIMVDKTTQTQLINGRLTIVRLAADNKPEGEYAITPVVVVGRIAQCDVSNTVLHSTLGQGEQDEDDPYADFKVPDDLMWQPRLFRRGRSERARLLDMHRLMADGVDKAQFADVQHQPRSLSRVGQLPTTVQIAARDRIAQQPAADVQLMGTSGLRGKRHPS